MALRNFNIDFFNWYFVMPSRSATGYFNSLKLKLMFWSSRLLSIISYLAFSSLVTVVELCTLLFYEVIVLKFRLD